MEYSLVDFAKSLRAESCKIRNTPNLIFLCGGRTAGAGIYKSARDYFYRHLKSNAAGIATRVKLAEDVNAWFHSGVFPDLLELENYLADLADITVLFVESPGSIAELGAFSASDALRPKTLAVINNFYDSDRSFIAEGPIKKMKNENVQLVHYYKWDPDSLNSPATKREFKDMARDLAAFLRGRDKSLPMEQKFDKTKHGHALLLVADLIGISGVATITEVANCLRELGCEFGQLQLGRYLSLLESMSFIKQVLRSNQTFYISTSSKSYIRYAYQPNVALKDITRIRSAVRGALAPMPRKILRDFLKHSGQRGTPHG